MAARLTCLFGAALVACGLALVPILPAYAQDFPTPPPIDTTTSGTQGLPCSGDCEPPPPTYGVSVTPDWQPTERTPNILTSVTFTVRNTGNVSDTYSLWCSTTGSVTCQQADLGTMTLAAGAQSNKRVFFTTGAANTTGTVGLGAINANDIGNSGSYNVSIFSGPPPVVSLAPSSPGYNAAADGVTYAHTLPAFGSMGVLRTLTLAYNSTAVRPVSLVTVDVSNTQSPYPSTYQIQVQLASNGTYVQLMNGTSSAYYTAATTTPTRMVAAIDALANGLNTGWYPVNVIVSAHYAEGPRATTVSSRLLVNNETGSSFGAGVGLAGIPRLHSMPGSYGLLLVSGEGSMAYFDRSCSTCAFVSPAGESRTLAVYNDPVLGQLYRLTAIDRSIADFRTDGRLVRHFVLPGIQDLTFTWTDTLLTAVTDATGRGLTLAYWWYGKLERITDPAGRVTAVAIVNGQLVKVTDPDGLKDSLSYGANSFLTQVTDRAGGVWNYGYNPLNQLSTVTAPAAVDYTGASVRPVTSYTTVAVVVWQPGTPGTSASAPKANVRPDTVMMSTTDPLGYVAKTALDRFGLATKIVDALGQVTTITRDTLGNARETRAPNGHTVFRNYNGYLLTSESDPSTGWGRGYTYNASNQLQTLTGVGPRQLDFYYHDGTQGPAGTLKLVYAGNTAPPPHIWGGAVVSWHYPNARGQDTLVIDGGDHRTRFEFAAVAAGGNLLRFTDPKGHVTSYHYNAYGLVDTTTLATGAKVVTGYDVMNRDTASVNELGYRARYFYSPLGLTRIQDLKGQVYKFGLNPWGLLVARHDLGDTTKVDSLKYDVGGHLRTVRTRRGDVITMTYDALGRLRTRSGPDFPAESFTYGANGAWLVAANANGRDSVAYDAAGRPLFASQRMPDGTTTYQMSYTYDSRRRPVGRSAPAGGSITRWGYDENLGTLDTLCGVGTCAVIVRDAETKPITLTYSSGQSGAWSHVQVFDSLHRVTRDSFTVSQLESTLGSRWTYDSLSRMVAAAQPAGTQSPRNYRYDAAGQLKEACVASLCSVYDGIFSYDAAGNRTESFANPVIGPGNRVQRFKGYAVSHDLNGGVLSKAGLGNSDSWQRTDTTTFQWNALGQLTRVEKWPPGGTHTVTTFAYDALGRRVARTLSGVTTWFVYDGDHVVMDVNAASRATIAEYAFYPGTNDLFAMRTPSDTLVAIKDPVIHSVLGLARARGGAEIKRYGIPTSPWGEMPSDTGTVVRFRVGGQEYDQETGLYYLRARYYDPQLGRFLSEDPIGVAGGLNLYAYAGNDPVNGRDPSGLRVPTVDGFGGGCGYAGRTLDNITEEFEGGVHYRTYHWTDWYVCSGGDGGSGGFRGGMGGGAGAGAVQVGYTPCSRGFLDSECARIRQTLTWIRNHPDPVCRTYGHTATRRFEAGNFAFDSRARQWTTHGLAYVTGYVIEGDPTSYLTGLAFRRGELAATIVEEEYHHRFGLTSETNAASTADMCGGP